MPAVLIAHSTALDAASADRHAAWLKGVHRDELLRLVDGLETYDVYRDLTPDGTHFTGVGTAPSVDAATLASQLGAAAPQFTRAEFMVAEGENAARLHFADVTD